MTNYVFSASLINEDYHTILIERKKTNALKIKRSLCKSTWLAIFSSCAIGSDLFLHLFITPERTGKTKTPQFLSHIII